MPLPVQIYNEYRRRALAYFWQTNGIEVISTISFSTPETYNFCFSGLPKHSVIATSTVEVCRREESRKTFIDRMTEAIKRLEPSDVILYGSDDLEVDYKGAKVHKFRNSVTDRMANNGR